MGEGNILSVGVKMDTTITKYMVVNSLLRAMTSTVTGFDQVFSTGLKAASADQTTSNQRRDGCPIAVLSLCMRRHIFPGRLVLWFMKFTAILDH